MIKILIAIPTAETVCNETMQSIYELIKPEGVETIVRIIHSYNIADGRNTAVDIMFSENCDYIFFVDSDVVLPKNALIDLYNMQWFISVGTYPRKEMQTLTDKDPYTTLYYHSERNKTVFCPYFLPFSALEEGKITPVDACGMGCVLIRKDLFSHIEKPYFFFAHEGDPGASNTEPYCIGEDLYFCRKVIQSGIQIWAHGSVICGHIGKFIYRLVRK